MDIGTAAMWLAIGSIICLAQWIGYKERKRRDERDDDKYKKGKIDDT